MIARKMQMVGIAMSGAVMVLPRDGLRDDDAGNRLRVVEGCRRAYIADFVRDVWLGGCTAGAPPANLGFRVVRDDESHYRLRSLVGRVQALFSSIRIL